MRFPAGRYHATPWGSHVNEADVEWPPSPWRILRALIASWHRKVAPGPSPDDLLSALLDLLSASEPVYRLPAAWRAHTRHYMPVRAGAADRPVLVFDAFVRLDPAEELIVAWNDVTLDPEHRDLLDALARATGYLGRAESWVEARLLDGYGGAFNSGPVHSEESLVTSAPVPVKLLAPSPAPAYAEWRSRSVNELGLDARRLTRGQRGTLETLPPRLIDALRLDTSDVRDAGWNLPPGGRMVTYQRPRFDVPKHPGEPDAASRLRRITTVRLALAGKPLPRIEDALRMGELVRAAAIKAADRIGNGDDDGVPPEISGHGIPDDGNHQHAFYLPEDANDDGFIDHILVHAPGGLSRRAVAAFDEVSRRGLWIRNGGEWSVLFEGAWPSAVDSGSTYGGTARTWVSATPYLRPWHAKPGFGTAEQVSRECERRGLPHATVVRALPSIRIRGRERRPVHFHRFRSKPGLLQPDRHGSIIEVVFSRPVTGPLALGFGCHYGLGMLQPAVQDHDREPS
jgi:CRISPR-associated protein Csb2